MIITAFLGLALLSGGFTVALISIGKGYEGVSPLTTLFVGLLMMTLGAVYMYHCSLVSGTLDKKT